ncbi:MAG: efflux RND transporter periplasmic adaptor subunit [Pseudomonadota bacterium]
MQRSSWNIVLVGCIGAVVCGLILLSGPEPLEANVPPQAARVTVGPLQRVTISHDIVAFGTLTPRQSLQVTTQVPGELTWVSPQLVPGGNLSQGDVLLRVDKRDYAIALASAQARRAQAEANIELEQGRAEIARLEWQTWEADQAEQQTASPLALRAPQQAQAQANLQAIRAELDGAALALVRTEVRAPWAATVVEANAVSGQVLGVGEVTATLLPLDYGVVEVEVPVQSLQLLDTGVANIWLRPVHDPDGDPVPGTLDGVVRTLTESTRLATVRVRVETPLDIPGWTFGMHMRAEIVTRAQRPVARVPAELIIGGNLIWLYREERAVRHQIKPIRSAAGRVTVEDNFLAGDALILERSLGLFDGVRVQTQSDAVVSVPGATGP